MAVTCMWRVRKRLDTVIDYVRNPEKTISEEVVKEIYPDDDLESVLKYAANEEKTEKMMYVGGVNVNPGIAYEEMTTVKRQFDKTDGILAWHGYMSFKPGEVTAAKAHEIGMEFAKKMWSDYQVVVATHCNTGVYHCHFVVNSVSYKTGKRIHDETSWFRFRHAADEICRAHGLSTVEKSGHGRMPEPGRGHGRSIRYALIRQAVDAAIAGSTNLEDFKRSLRKMGYHCNLSPSRKYWSVTPAGEGRAALRLYRLGDEYTNTAIRERLLENQKRTVQVGEAKEQNRAFSLFILRLKKYTGKKDWLVGLYWHYRYLLGNVQKNPKQSVYLPHRLKEDVARLKEISEEAKFLSENKIETLSELRELMEKYEAEIADFEEYRKKLRNEFRRKDSGSRREEIRGEIFEASAALEKSRKALKQCKSIEARSASINENIEAAETQQKRIEESERRENGWTLEQTQPGRS